MTAKMGVLMAEVTPASAVIADHVAVAPAAARPVAMWPSATNRPGRDLRPDPQSLATITTAVTGVVPAELLLGAAQARRAAQFVRRVRWHRRLPQPARPRR